MIEYIDKKKARLIISVGGRKDRKRVYKTITYKGKKDAERQHDDFKRLVLSEGLPDDITVKELLDWYISTSEGMGARPTTIQGYKSTAKRLNSAFGGVKAGALTTYRIEKDIALNREFSPKTVKNTVSLLSSAYKKAVASGMLTSNPCENVQIPKQDKKEITILHPNDVQLFLAALDGEPFDFKVACELALFCGLRRSEVLGLTESSISDLNNIIMITQGRHRISYADKVTEPKTSKSRRAVAVPPGVMQDIKTLIHRHRNSEFPCCEYLLQDGFGEPMKPHYLTEHIGIFERNNGLPHVSFHGLRHTHASMLNRNGVDIARISAQLGHSQIGVTMNTYMHLFGSDLQSTQAIAEKMEEVWQNGGRILEKKNG